MRLRRDFRFGLFALGALAIGCSGNAVDGSRPVEAASPPPATVATPPPTITPATAETLLAELPDASPRERFLAATRLLLDTPYENGPLGEGEDGSVDPDPRLDFSRADCVTYLEQSLALALTPSGEHERLLPVLDAIRYREGNVSFAARNHYMVRDWIPANQWLVEDVTSQVAGGRTLTVSRTIDRETFLKDQGAEPRPDDDSREISIEIIPREDHEAVAPSIRAGDLVFWVGKHEGIFVMHTGLAERDGEGGLVFRHASSAAERALDEPFAEYAERSDWALGLLVLRVRDEPSLPRSG